MQQQKITAKSSEQSLVDFLTEKFVIKYASNL